MTPWNERSVEEQNLLNPGFCTMLLWHAAQGGFPGEPEMQVTLTLSADALREKMFASSSKCTRVTESTIHMVRAARGETAMRVTLSLSADTLARAYFGGSTGCVRATDGLTSEGRPVRFIAIARGSRRITLSGVHCGRRWEQTYPSTGAPIDD